MTVLTYLADPASGERRMEQAFVTPRPDGLSVRGTILVASGELTEPDGPFTCTYELELDPGPVHRRLSVRTVGAGWRRELELGRDPVTGDWHGLPDPELVAGALDVDLLSSAVFTMMPVARSGLHRRPGRREFRMAWVSLPDLVVTGSDQVYGHVRPGTVSFESEDGFTAEIDVDPDGFALRHPQVALRV